MVSTVKFQNESYKPIFLDGKLTNYAVSTAGKIVNFKRQKSLKLSKTSNGYLKVCLYTEDGMTQVSIHRLVAVAFIPNPDNLATVNHIDEDKTNNDVSNLEWMTQPDNTEYSVSKHYIVTKDTGEVVKVFNLNKFCKENGYTNGGLYALMSGKCKHHKDVIHVKRSTGI